MSDVFWVQVFGFLALLVPIIVAAVNAVIARKVAKGTHDLVNSRMTELLEITRTASKAEGVKEEKDKGNG